MSTWLSSLAIFSALTKFLTSGLDPQILGGYCLWVASMVVLLVGSIVLKSADHAKTLTAPPPDAEGAIRNMAPRVGWNDSRPCGSGKKYKKCCGSPR